MSAENLNNLEEESLEPIMAHDITEEDQEKSFFCDTNGENYYLMGFCVGKVVTYWIGAAIAAAGGMGGILTYIFG